MSSELAGFVLVEDNDDHATLIKKTLASCRVTNEITVFRDAESALEHLTGCDEVLPLLVLLDINLPGMDGLELLRILKTHDRLKQVPAVMLSTSDADVDRIKAYEYSANSYLTKPMDFVQFQKMVHDVGLYWSLWNKPSHGSHNA